MAEARELLEIKQRLALVEARLQQLFQHLDIAPRESAGGGGWGGGGEEGEPLDPLSDREIQDLLVEGNEIQAIKRYLELTGLEITKGIP
jgi:hypothetical protein